MDKYLNLIAKFAWRESNLLAIIFVLFFLNKKFFNQPSLLFVLIFNHMCLLIIIKSRAANKWLPVSPLTCQLKDDLCICGNVYSVEEHLYFCNICGHTKCKPEAIVWGDVDRVFSPPPYNYDRRPQTITYLVQLQAKTGYKNPAICEGIPKNIGKLEFYQLLKQKTRDRKILAQAHALYHNHTNIPPLDIRGSEIQILDTFISRIITRSNKTSKPVTNTQLLWNILHEFGKSNDPQDLFIDPIK